jgi:MscS family membrane protein
MRTTILKACIALIAIFFATIGNARGEDASPDLNPLRPADTSSPRTTLSSFLSDADFLIRSSMSNEPPSQERILAYMRAIETLDLSNTPNGDLSRVQVERVVLLKEILDRIPLPDESSIPDSTALAAEGIVSWTIPDTRIRIAQVESGPRAGEFLFSASTVEQLLRLYRLTKDLPYQPGATPGAYDFLLEQRKANLVPAGSVSRRLRPVDTSTPRTVMQEFMKSVNQAYALVMEAENAWRANPRSLTRAEARRLDAEARQLIERAATAFDLSEVAEVRREDAAIEAVLQLKEILDRVQLPLIDSVPDALDVGGLREAQETPTPIRWRIPNTPLEIAEMSEGDRQGEFLLSASSVALLDNIYWQIADLPYRQDLSEVEIGYASVMVSPDFYQYFTSTTGHLVPYASLTGRLLADLPPWLTAERFGQTLWQWIGLVACILLLIVAASLIFRLVWRFALRLPKPLDSWLRVLAPMSIASLVNLTAEFVALELNVTGDPLAVATTTSGFVVIVMHGLALFLVFRALGETVVARTSIGATSMDASLIRLSAEVLGFLAAIYVVVAGARSLGADLFPLIAGLGVGGLAIALAAQKTLANFLGSIVLFVERPVREGEFFSAGDLVGTVEKIGLHSTRVRTLERTVVTVPNAQFSELQINNISRRDRRLLKTQLPLRDDTSTGQMRDILQRIQTLLSEHPKVLPAPRVRFTGFGDYSENIDIFAYLDCVDQTDFLTIQEELLMRIEDIIIEAGSGFALPSQITHLVGSPESPPGDNG